MNDFARLELDLMARARDAIEPEPADRARLRVQLEAKIALLGSAAVTSSLASSTRPWRHLLNSHLTALSTVAAITGAVAFGTGYFAGHRTRAVVVKTVTVTDTRPTSTVAGSLATASNRIDPASLTSSSSDWGHNGTRPRVTVPAAPNANAPDNSLSQELDLLRRAERTIRTGNSLVALGLLRDLDEKFPRGQLLEERTAAKVMANCQLADADEARAKGNAYLFAHPQSVYADRVRTLCRLDSAKVTKDSPAGGN